MIQHIRTLNYGRSKFSSGEVQQLLILTACNPTRCGIDLHDGLPKLLDLRFADDIFLYFLLLMQF